MNILKLYSKLKEGYKDYISSFISIKDPRIREEVSKALADEKLWPDALIQFNPNFKQGIGVKEMIEKGWNIHPDLKHFFNRPFYLHQQEAVFLGSQDKEFIVTSGTGSGKSRTFMATIFNYVLRNPEKCKEKTIAIIVYPMNALINSQEQELEGYKVEFENATGKECPISFGKYTGQENDTARQRIQDNPPNIILTNYMMLELLMTRAGKEESLRKCFLDNLRFLVFDELHTYRGMQGSDVSMLIRRIRNQAKGKVYCFGTSATMVAEERMSYIEQKEKVAEVASCIFGSKYTSENIIDETLELSFSDGKKISKSELAIAVRSTIDTDGDIDFFKNYPTAIWLEQNIALNYNNEENRYFRGKPLSIDDIAAKLNQYLNGIGKEICKSHLEQFLNWSNKINQNSSQKILPYKIHQFIPQTGNVYATLGTPEIRQVTVEEKLYFDDNSEGNDKQMFFPIVFSRLSGHEFYVVNVGEKIMPRNFEANSFADEDEVHNGMDGYIVIPHTGEDPQNYELDLESDDIPDEWFTYNKKGERKLKKNYESRIPRHIWFDSYGHYSEEEESPGEDYIEGWLVPSPLQYDPSAKIVYSGNTKEWSKLSKIGGEGRSTATTILSYENIMNMDNFDVPYSDRKVMTFVDARQDAALQAGHFNDFVKVSRIRNAIWKAVSNSNTPLDSSNIGRLTFEALDLQPIEYLLQPKRGGMLREQQNIFVRYLETKIFDDLLNNWTVIMPDLEDCALLSINYKYLHDEIAGENGEERLYDVETLTGLSDEDKEEFIIQILDYFRHRGCLKSVDRTEATVQDLTKQIRDNLKSPWTLEDNENIVSSRFLYLDRQDINRRYSHIVESGGPRSKLATFVKDYLSKHNGPILQTDEDYINYMHSLFADLDNYIYNQDGLYQLDYSMLLWVKGDECSIRPDLTRFRQIGDVEIEKKPNHYFQLHYKKVNTDKGGFEAKDHTGQVSKEERELREQQFREGEFPILFCSPTMELGIDIRELSVVGMRNVPPTPANYTQRAGRAGRSGQAALIYTYCRPRNSHENYYLRNPQKMVSGEVKAPKMELVNEELLKTHLHSTILSMQPIPQLSEGISELVDYTDLNNIFLKDEVKHYLHLSPQKRLEIQKVFNKIISDQYFKERYESEKPVWFTSDWIDRVMNSYERDFDKALDRWRSLYREAQTQILEATKIIENRLYGENSIEKKNAHQKMRRAENMRDMLLGKNQGKNKEENEFYPYRYFASEGFLPGYNFTKLPQRATLQYKGDKIEFISRPKSLALKEFGPNNIIYNNGGKFRVTRMMLSADPQNHKFIYNPHTGYINKDEANSTNHIDVITGEPLQGNSRIIGGYCVPAGDMIATEETKITCQEEERSRKSYNVDIYFSSDDPRSISESELKLGESHLANIRYIPSCRLIYFLSSKNEDYGNGFPLDTATGEWIGQDRVSVLRKKEQEDPQNLGRLQFVKLFAETTANAIYIQPSQALLLRDNHAVRTFLYAFKQAIEDVFQIEGSEMGGEIMGEGSLPNIFIYENAEGSLGVLSRLVEEPESYRQVVKRAYEICFDKPEYTQTELEALIPADYTNLLNYYNQPYHQNIDIRKIYDTLKLMERVTPETHYAGRIISYDDQYRQLEEERDHNSSTEYEFLKYLYDNRLRLPDKAQPSFPNEYYVKPDFMYGDRIVIFCDGTPHDRPEIKADDLAKREVLEDAGYVVLSWHYRTPIKEFVASHPDIFTSVN